MEKGFTVWLVAVFVILGGCMGTGEPEDAQAGAPGPTTTSGGPNQNADGFGPGGVAELPTWTIGDWWEYTVQYTSGESYTAKVIVHAEDGANYYLTSDSTELLMRAAFTHYPTFGSVKKSSLEHVIHGVDVSFLRFPMQNQTWEAPYRDFTGQFSSSAAVLSVGGKQVPGFRTTMTNAADGTFRMINGWSPVTKYFTDFTWDFDGVEPFDVSFNLKSWGSNHTGTVPVLEITEGTHRTFPTLALAPPNPASPPASSPEARSTFTVPDGADLLAGMFAGAGGPGEFEFHVFEAGSAQRGSMYPWRPTSAGSHFEWHLMEDVPPGQWNIVGGGAAQNFAFLFLEVYAVKTNMVQL